MIQGRPEMLAECSVHARVKKFHCDHFHHHCPAFNCFLFASVKYFVASHKVFAFFFNVYS